MGKLLLILVCCGILTAAIGYFILTNVGDLRPALLPAKHLPINTETSRDPDGPNIGAEVTFGLQVSDGFKIGLYAQDLGKVRDLIFSPEGVLLASIQDKGQVVALFDKNNDGIVDSQKVVLEQLINPHGLAFHEGGLFVAQETKITRYAWDSEKTEAGLEYDIMTLPTGGNHVTRSLVFDRNGRMLVSIGSTCNVCVEKNKWHGSVIATATQGGTPEIYASGLRNAVFLALNPVTDQIWVTEMGRDFLGDALPPDEINVLSEGGDFGWPFCYGDRISDKNFSAQGLTRCTQTIPAHYQLPAHSAPLGLTFIYSDQFPAEWQGDLLVALHGSWNSTKPVGYKIVRLDVNNDGNITQEVDFLTGFLQGSQVLGRPVDMIFDREGSLYISDDKAGNIFKVIRKP